MTVEFMQTHNLVVSTLSPIHIGCGKDFEPTEYVVDSHGTLHAFDPAAIFTLDSFPKISERILAALDKGTSQEQLRAVHAAFQNSRDEISGVAGIHVKLASGVFAHYRQTQDARNDFNKNGVERSSYNPFDQLPILPGSSIKGAMRTAILNTRKPDRPALSDQLAKQISAFNMMIEEYEINGKKQLRLKAQHSKRDYDQARKDIEKALAKQAGSLGEQWLGGKFATDPLRALKIGDACSLDPLIEREIRFCVNRNRAGRKSQAQSKGLYTRLEYVAEHQPSLFEIAITVQNLSSIAGQRKQNGELLAPLESNLTSMPEVISACNGYYLPRLEKDLQLTKALHPGSTWAASAEHILNSGLRDEIKTGQAILLRVGKHGGADNNTVEGRQIKIMLSEDRRPLRDCRTENIRLYIFDAEPRTTWFCADELENPPDLLPHGWIVLSKPARSWIEKLPGYARRKHREQKIQEEEQQRLADEAEARKQAEAEAARQAALAGMSQNLRQIEELRAEIEARIAKLPGGRKLPISDAFFGGHINKLAEQAHSSADWSREDKTALANMLEEWAGRLMALDAKDLRKKLKLAALRGQT